MLTSAIASAHIEVISGPAIANSSQSIVLGVGHGCAGADTAALTIDIPAGVTSVRPLPNDFGVLSETLDTNGNVTAVTWTKLATSVYKSDIAYYQFVMKIAVPNQPFTTILFPAHQTCIDSTGTQTVVDWTAASETAGGGEPAPSLQILPARYAGWNQFTVPATVTDMSAYFSDAQIVWKGNAAYSINPTTMTQIGQTSGVTALSSLSASDVIWARY